MITRATEYIQLMIPWPAVVHWVWMSVDSQPILMPIWPPPPTTVGETTFSPAWALSGDIAPTVVVKPTRCPGLKRQISMDTSPTVAARFLPTVRLCRTCSRREPLILWIRLSSPSNIPRPRSLPGITMGYTPCHHARLLNRFRVRCQTPTFLSVIQLPLPRLLPQALANRQSNWRLRSTPMLSHLPRTPTRRRRYPPMLRTALLRPVSVRLRPSPTASRASPVPSIQNPEAWTSTQPTSTPIRDVNHSKRFRSFPSLPSPLFTAVPSSVLDQFSSLGIEGHITASPTDSENRSPEQAQTSENTSGVNTAYASPNSNLSNGDSPHPSTKPVQFALTSELASALSPNTDGSVPYVSGRSVPSGD